MTTVLGFGRPSFVLSETSLASPLRVEGRAPSVLAIHGFTGVPYEVGAVVEAAEALGLRGHAPLLPGHGTDARELQRTSWADWVRAAESELFELSEEGPVLLAGLSLGSVIAAHLAAVHPTRVKALALLGFAGWLPRMTIAWPLEAARLLGLGTRDLYLYKADGADIADPEAKRAHPSYAVHPVRAAIELTKLARVVRAELPRIGCPTLVMHGRRDIVCPPANVSRLLARLGSKDVEAVMLERSAHIITVDYERDLVKERVEAFFGRFASR